MSRIRLQDIAEQTGVSLTTASFALAGKGNISPVIQRKVQRAAREANYVSRKKKSLKKKLKCCGVLLDTSPRWGYAWNFVVPILNNLESELKQHGLFTTMIPLDQSPVSLTERLNAISCSAVFSMHYFNRDIFEKLENMNIPVVIINHTGVNESSFSKVCSDDFQGAYDGTKYLLDLGHRNILFMDYERPGMPDLISDRFVGFKKAFDEGGIDFPANRKLTVHLHSPDSIREKLASFVNGKGKFSAIFAHDDYLAAQIIHVLNEYGLSVPSDISIIAPGDVLDYSDLSSHRITTMKIDTPLMGQFAAQLMLNKLDASHIAPQVLRVSQSLINRGSCLRKTQ